MKKIICLVLFALCFYSCDFGTHVVNKISGHDECSDEDGSMVYHQESKRLAK